MNAPAPLTIAEIPRPRAHDAHLLGALFDAAAAYQSGAHYRDLLRFVARMRRFSPFNAVLHEKPETVSSAYLAGFIEAGEPIGRTLDVERVMRAEGAEGGARGEGQD